MQTFVKALAVALATLLPWIFSMPRAGAADGLYLGAAFGRATVQNTLATGEFDADDAAYKAFVGWRFDLIPAIDLALEAAYVNFGRPAQNVGGQNVQYRLHGGSAAGLLIFPLGPLDLYGKAGLMAWSFDKSSAGATSSRQGTDPFYGAGVGFNLWKVGIRAEFEQYRVKNIERVQMVSLGALFQF